MHNEEHPASKAGSPREVWADEKLSLREKHHQIWDRFLSTREQVKICRDCLKFREDCECEWPYPTQVNAYSRAQYDADLEGIEKLSADYSVLFNRGLINGIQMAKLDRILAKMREKCRSKLYISAQRAQDRQASKALQGNKPPR